MKHCQDCNHHLLEHNSWIKKNMCVKNCEFIEDKISKTIIYKGRPEVCSIKNFDGNCQDYEETIWKKMKNFIWRNE